MNPDFPNSFHPTRILRTGDVCSLKKHFSHAVREVIGYLETLAACDHERFVWCEIKNIVEHCNRYKGPGYSTRIVKYALAFLCENYVITPVELVRQVGAYERLVLGWVVMPHDALAKRTGNRCEWRPWSPEWRETNQPTGVHRKVHHKVHHRVHQKTTKSAPASAPQIENKCTSECTSKVHQKAAITHGKKKG
jgi:hypothetical protein